MTDSATGPVIPVRGDASKKGIRKAQALKANLAKRKQQQRARTTAASGTPTQSHSKVPQ
jgi:hypothetical protein